ncbi:hypothetical protein EWM64_g10679 [Hericium alpestre]|uniref:ATP-dependent DNA helicase n=1 Tax=Hericium alpestre TaxID=135208 RepID=A0A4Y9ZHN6_9AGAM|nr:hypothetical protein EWM64_g10679 [Hericium alpestre]
MIEHLSSEVQHELDRWQADASLSARAQAALDILNTEQQAIFDEVLANVRTSSPLLMFIDGKAGRGKTFLVNSLCDYLRAHNQIVLATATAAYAAQLYPGGRTTHSTFKVPVNEKSEMLDSPIQRNSPRAELLKAATLIIWDEAPMANKAVLSCVDDTLRRVMGNNIPFGGKILLLLGDFRQTCPVVRKGTRRQTVDASIRSSGLWDLFTVRRLTIPIRNAEDPAFAAFVDAIGDGAGPEIDLAALSLCSSTNDVIDFVYPGTTIFDPIAAVRQSILAVTNKQTDHYNSVILDRLPGPPRTYLAADSLKEFNTSRSAAPQPGNKTRCSYAHHA